MRFFFRWLTVCLSTLICCSFQAIGQKHNNDFAITIVEMDFGGGRMDIKITQDSIKAESHYMFRDGKVASVFKTPLIDDGRGNLDKLKHLLFKINLDELKESYRGNVLDGSEFEFTFNFDNKIKRTIIHYGRQTDIFNLVQQINEMIPLEFTIHYDADYFSDSK